MGAEQLEGPRGGAQGLGPPCQHKATHLSVPRSKHRLNDYSVDVQGATLPQSIAVARAHSCGCRHDGVQPLSRLPG